MGEPEPEPEMAEMPAFDFSAFMSAPASAPRKVSHHKGGGKVARIRDGLMSYYGLAGMLVSARNQVDGMLILSQAEQLTDAHLEVAKINPQYMRILDIITTGGPYTALFLIHGKLAIDIMRNHGSSPLELFTRSAGPNAPNPDTRADASAPPLPYQPVGPNAPTDTKAPPPPFPPVAATDELRIIPDEGLPADVDVALRQMSRQTGRPYAELRQEALVELAQLRMRQNNGHIQTPGALGAPITRG